MDDIEDGLPDLDPLLDHLSDKVPGCLPTAGSLVIGLLMGAALFAPRRDHSVDNQSMNLPPADKRLIPESDWKWHEDMHRKLRDTLRDPVKTDQIIEQIKDEPEVDKLMADPQVRKTLQRLMQAMQENNTQKTPSNWTDKTTQPSKERINVKE